MQPIENSQKKTSIYDSLKRYQLELIEKSDIGNWNSLAATARPSIQRVLHLSKLVELSAGQPGDIFEFGCHYGASTCLIHNLLEIHIPHSRKAIHTFDTFEGFTSLDENDDSLTECKNNIGDFNIAIENYESFLDQIIKLHHALDASISNSRSYSLIKGDASKTFPRFLADNPSTLASLVIFDMDLYKPTIDCLELVKSRLLPGSIIAFDEMLAFKQFPGESLAFQQCTYRDNLIPIKASFASTQVPFSAIFRYEP